MCAQWTSIAERQDRASMQGRTNGPYTHASWSHAKPSTHHLSSEVKRRRLTSDMDPASFARYETYQGPDDRHSSQQRLRERLARHYAMQAALKTRTGSPSSVSEGGRSSPSVSEGERSPPSLPGLATLLAPRDQTPTLTKRSYDTFEGSMNMRRSSESSSTASSGRLSPASSASPSATSQDSSSAITKSSRYLREMDRRDILQRIENGEKQATLAKEYQVSRAAICNLNKHRDLVWSRKDENPLAKHPKKPRLKVSPSAMDKTSRRRDPLYQIQSRAVTLHLSALQDRSTETHTFRRYANRLVRLVLEDALALVPTHSVKIETDEQTTTEGIHTMRFPCGIALEPNGGSALLRAFRMIEVEAPMGYIRSTATTTVETRLPLDMAHHNVFLFDPVSRSGTVLCNALAALLARGANPSQIWVVTLSTTTSVAAMVQTQFPTVTLVTAQVDSEETTATWHERLIRELVEAQHNMDTQQ